MIRTKTKERVPKKGRGPCSKSQKFSPGEIVSGSKGPPPRKHDSPEARGKDSAGEAWKFASDCYAFNGRRGGGVKNG